MPALRVHMSWWYSTLFPPAGPCLALALQSSTPLSEAPVLGPRVGVGGTCHADF